MSVREDIHGRLVEKAATDFDLPRPWSMRPKRRASRPTTATGTRCRRVELHNVAFEGFLFRREVVEAVGLPDPSFFIFYDDVDFALRARRAGFRIWAVRDAVLVRQLDFNQQHDLDGWKGYYMYRNLFVVHFRYGDNRWCAPSPTPIAAAVVALSPAARRQGRGPQRDPRHPGRSRACARFQVRAPPLARLTGHDRSGVLTLSKPDLVVVGSGFFGLTIAERCANELGLTSSSSSGDPTSAATPTARPTPRPASRCTSTARTSSTPPTSGCGSTSTASRRSPTTSTGSSGSTRARSTRCR